VERILVNGEWVDALSGKTLTIINPATLAELGTVPDCSASDVDRAVAAARAAQLSWWKMPGVEKARLLAVAMRAMESIKAGTFWINDPLTDNDAGPFGGMRHSGIGRELGAEGLERKPWWYPYRNRPLPDNGSE
jgi:acyl-CoA reductase-like NAD-dependent aldehyde dehydrogenase